MWIIIFILCVNLTLILGTSQIMLIICHEYVCDVVMTFRLGPQLSTIKGFLVDSYMWTWMPVLSAINFRVEERKGWWEAMRGWKHHTSLPGNSSPGAFCEGLILSIDSFKFSSYCPDSFSSLHFSKCFFLCFVSLKGRPS
jgi:hypothetical protein